MKVLDITTFYSTGRGGITTYLERKAELFSRRPQTSLEHVLILGGAKDDVASFHGSKCYWVKSRQTGGNPHYRYLLNFSKIFNILKKERPDVIETPDPYWTLLYLLLIRRVLRSTRLFFFYRSDFPDTYVTPVFERRGWTRLGKWVHRFCWWYLRRVLNRVNGVLVHSDVMKEKLIAHGITSPIDVVGNLTDFDAFLTSKPDLSLPQAINKRFNHAGPLLLYCGRLGYEKGIELLLDTFELVKCSHPDAVLIMVGSGELGDKIRQVAADPDNRIHFLPSTADRAYLSSLFSACDVMVVPGPHETFSMVTLEGIVSGLPVAGINGTGGIKALIKPGVGFLSEERTPQSLHEAVEQALQPKSSWYQPEVRKRIIETYRPERVERKLLQAYGIWPTVTVVPETEPTQPQARVS